jgi:hypothetical protein
LLPLHRQYEPRSIPPCDTERKQREELDDVVLAKLALCHSRIVALGSADAAAGKHVKLVRDEMSSALVQDFRPGQKER